MNKDQLFSVLIGILILILLILGGIIFVTLKPKAPIESFSEFVISPSPSINLNKEPDINSYIAYSNDTYFFSLAIPNGWKTQDYSKAHPQGGSIVAFSPDELPCDSCTYFKNGYFSIHIYNEKSHPEQYALFIQKINAIGKNKNYKEITIDGKKGVYSIDSVAVFHQGWVYEFKLDKDIGKQNIAESKIIVTVISSFKFTGLEFGK